MAAAAACGPARRHNRVTMLLHSSSYAASANVNGQYHPDARPVVKQMTIEHTRPMKHLLLVATRKSPLITHVASLLSYTHPAEALQPLQPLQLYILYSIQASTTPL